MDTNDCIYTAGKWFCQNTCDDPTHGHHGPPRVFYRGHYYRPGQLITDDI
jgi:hypothetical protein